MNKGYSPHQAEIIIIEAFKDIKWPVTLRAFGRIEDPPEKYLQPSAAMRSFEFKELETLYKLFRTYRPRGRWSLAILDSGNRAIFLDTQLFEKATGKREVR